ncbi:MAG: FlgO family outer membrane protein, partial [Pseudomonadota bacterium]
MFESAVIWAKEYGDVLGTVGFLSALTTVVLTNGRLILQRFYGEQMSASDSLRLGSSNEPVIRAYGDRTPIAVTSPKLLGEVESHFSAGLADDIIADLQALGFAIPDMNSVDQLVLSGDNLPSVARKLHVPYVLTSSVRRQDNKVRINVQLISDTGAVLWSQRYNSEGYDLLAIQEHTANQVAQKVADIIKPSNAATDPVSGQDQAAREQALKVVSSPKSRLTAFLLCAPLIGIFGIHRFYVGRPLTGILYFVSGGCFMFGWLIDCLLIMLGM